MDVHIDNQVLSGLGTPLLVHLFVPDTVMAELCPNRVPNCEGAWCQTLFSDRTGLTRVCRVFAARGMLPGRPSHRGTFTSVPVYCEEGLPELYNPFHVAALRFYDEGGLVGELQIYYLSLFEGAKSALTDGHLIREASGVQESAAAMQPIPIDPGPPGGAGIEHMPVAAAQVEHPKTYDLKQILLEITRRGWATLGVRPFAWGLGVRPFAWDSDLGPGPRPRRLLRPLCPSTTQPSRTPATSGAAPVGKAAEAEQGLAALWVSGRGHPRGCLFLSLRPVGPFVSRSPYPRPRPLPHTAGGYLSIGRHPASLVHWR